MVKHVVVSLSGGMDSSTLLLRCLKEYDTVTALSFNYGQKHVVEIERAQSLVKYLNEANQSINYRVIKLDGLVDLLNSSLIQGGAEVPEGHYAEENMKATVVPNRNIKFSLQLLKQLHFQSLIKQVNNVILQWAFMLVTMLFIQIVVKSSEMQMIMPLEWVTGVLKK